jgi:hypothetical protein
MHAWEKSALESTLQRLLTHKYNHRYEFTSGYDSRIERHCIALPSICTLAICSAGALTSGERAGTPKDVLRQT